MNRSPRSWRPAALLTGVLWSRGAAARPRPGGACRSGAPRSASSRSIPFEAGAVYCGTSRGNFYGSEDGGDRWEPLRAGPRSRATSVRASRRSAASRAACGPRSTGNTRAGWSSAATTGADVDDAGALEDTPSRRAPSRSPPGPDAGLRGRAETTGCGSRATEGGRGSRAARAAGASTRSSRSPSIRADPRTLYAGTWRQAFRTRDGGATWARIAEGMVLDATVYAWDFDRRTRATSGSRPAAGSIARRDGGDHWTRFKTGFTNRRSHAIRRDPEPARRRLRGDRRRAAPFDRRRRDLDARSRGSRSSSPRSRSIAARVASTSAPKGKASSIPTTAARRSPTARSGWRRAAWPTSFPIPTTRRASSSSAPTAATRAGSGRPRGCASGASPSIRCRASASLAAFRGAAGGRCSCSSSSSGVRISRDGGAALGRSGLALRRGRRSRSSARPSRCAVLVTSAGVFRRGRRRARASRPIAGGPAAPAGGRAPPRFRPAAPCSRCAPRTGRCAGTARSGRAGARGSLKGGIFLRRRLGAVRRPLTARSRSRTERSSGRRADSRLSVTSPRPGLALATAAAAPGGRLATSGRRGTGLFLFEP